MQVLARGGRLVLIGLMGGARAELDLGAVLARHLLITGSTLRTPPGRGEGRARALLPRALRRRPRGTPHPPHPRLRAAAAPGPRRRTTGVEASLHFGKVVLRVRDG